MSNAHSEIDKWISYHEGNGIKTKQEGGVIEYHKQDEEESKKPQIIGKPKQKQKQQPSVGGFKGLRRLDNNAPVSYKKGGKVKSKSKTKGTSKQPDYSYKAIQAKHKKKKAKREKVKKYMDVSVGMKE